MNKKTGLKEWQDVRAELFSPEEIAESNLRVALIEALIKARKERGITQKELEQISGVKQPIISRLESGNVSPNIETVIKLLYPLGKTLYIGDVNEGAKDREAFAR